MTPQVKFTRGAASLDLTQSPYLVGPDFTPPAINPAYNISVGTSANVTGGGELIGGSLQNRQFTFRVRILASSMTAAGMSARRLASFVKVVSSETLYLEYRQDASLPVPLWGQFGAPLRYEVITADVGSPNSMYVETLGRGFFVDVTLEVAPLAIGKTQKLANAAGYVFEDIRGQADGTARGLMLAEATTNKMTNPVFGKDTNYIVFWTGGSSIILRENKDPRYTLPGLFRSAKFSSSATTNNTTSQSIAAGNTNKHSFSAYIYLPDLGTPDANDMQIYYGAAQDTTFQEIGAGLWLAYSDNIDGVSAGTATGIVVKSGRTIYLAGYQMEEKAYHTPLAYGDLLGCAWTGTEHESTSTRTASNVSIAVTESIISLAEGAVSVVWKPYHANTFAVDQVLFGLYKADYSASGLVGYFESADDKFYLTDGTNTISTAAQTYAAGDTLYLKFTWGPGGLNIYKSGVNAATGATYTPAIAANQAVLSIGGANSATIAQGDILGFDIYETELSAAQAAAIYSAQAAVIAGSGRPSLIPWLWTKDGDGVVDNCNDTNRDNWAVAGGIAGSVDAHTLWNLRPSGAALTVQVTISNLQNRHFVSPNGFYAEMSGNADANSSGGEYNLIARGPGDTVHAFATLSKRELFALSGKEIFYYSRMADAGITLKLQILITMDGGTTIYGDAKTIAMGGTIGLQSTPPMVVPDFPLFGNDLNFGTSTYLGLLITRISASANVTTDFADVLIKPIMNIIGGASSADAIIIDKDHYQDYDGGNLTYGTNDIDIVGEVIELRPGNYNHLVSLMGTPTSMAVASTLNYYEIIIAPRYALL